MAHLKYPTYASGEAHDRPVNMSPSMMLDELSRTEPRMKLRHQKPEIVEFLNMADYTTQTTASVSIDEPLFQPFPMGMVFRDYKPFSTYEQTLYFRNNDNARGEFESSGRIHNTLRLAHRGLTESPEH
jgi:hypothetical protein